MLQVVHEPDEKGRFRLVTMIVTAKCDMYWELVSKKKETKMEAISSMNSYIEATLKWGVISITTLALQGASEDMRKVGERIVREVKKSPVQNKGNIMESLKYLLLQHKGEVKDSLTGLVELYSNTVEEHKDRFK